MTTLAALVGLGIAAIGVALVIAPGWLPSLGNFRSRAMLWTSGASRILIGVKQQLERKQGFRRPPSPRSSQPRNFLLVELLLLGKHFGSVKAMPGLPVLHQRSRRPIWIPQRMATHLRIN
ncbi:MAG: hypothetical protein DSY92_08375 [Planctomycetota bacterium]|nr:MAG: hypothetical protein DSY92_08375 [Planctomycetota bacterium]